MEANNIAKLREAIEDSNGLLEELAILGEWEGAAKEQIAANRAALAEPPRNCNVGTAKEQNERYVRYCQKQRASACNPACPLYKQRMSGVLCSLIWAQLPYEEGVSK